ncbi:MAG: hypothetical protein IKS85_06835, partial [Lachnospiraceae bacterium]|nr:hypothetical protein [Lachnospiraceae bacterium]
MRKYILRVSGLRLFAVGFLFGILLELWQPAGWEGGLLTPENLCRIKWVLDQGDGICISFLWLALFRIRPVLLMLLAGTTYLASFVGSLVIAWMGLGLGKVLMTVLLQYGFQGLLLFGTLLLPHWLPYGMAFYCLLKLCGEIRDGLQRGRISEAECMLKVLLIILL